MEGKAGYLFLRFRINIHTTLNGGTSNTHHLPQTLSQTIKFVSIVSNPVTFEFLQGQQISTF